MLPVMSQSFTYWLQRGSVGDEIERLEKKQQHMSEARLLRLLCGLCDGIRELHFHNPKSYAHRLAVVEKHYIEIASSYLGLFLILDGYIFY